MTIYKAVKNLETYIKTTDRLRFRELEALVDEIKKELKPVKEKQ